jgi:hypothetical protein
MPANRGGDTKQGLIIALVCFVVLTLVLGVTTYLGYDGQANLAKNEKEAKGKVDAANKERDWWKYRALAMQYYAGQLKLEPEMTAWTSMRGQKPTGENGEAFEKVVQTLDQRLVREDKKGFESYTDKVERLEKDLADTRGLLAKCDDNLKKAQADNKKEKSDNEQLTAQLIEKFKKDLEAERERNAAIEKNLLDKLAEFGDLTKQLAELKKKSEGDTTDWEKSRKKLQGEIENLRLNLTKTQEKLKPPDLFKFDNPKGKIVRLDPKGEIAWINVGSADGLRPQQSLTFAIFGSGAGVKTGGERKGALEVVDVLNAHLSMAKITDVTDPNSHPIVPGDLLINPAWSPGMRTHLALAGLFDLTGEGRDQIDELMRTLRREGVVIDAYLDLKDKTVKGDGMTIKTDYLVLGEQPTFETSSTIKPEDARVQRKMDIHQKLAEMQGEANRLGTTVVPFRRFVLLTGYRLPKGVGIAPGAGYDFIRPSETLSTESKPGAKKPAAKEEKKEKEDEDKDK